MDRGEVQPNLRANAADSLCVTKGGLVHILLNVGEETSWEERIIRRASPIASGLEPNTRRRVESEIAARPVPCHPQHAFGED